jgi:hypothetical protein
LLVPEPWLLSANLGFDSTQYNTNRMQDLSLSSYLGYDQCAKPVASKRIPTGNAPTCLPSSRTQSPLLASVFTSAPTATQSTRDGVDLKGKASVDLDAKWLPAERSLKSKLRRAGTTTAVARLNILDPSRDLVIVVSALLAKVIWHAPILTLSWRLTFVVHRYRTFSDPVANPVCVIS